MTETGPLQTATAAAPFPTTLANRFRGYLPVVVDVETGGFDWNKHALLEIAVQPLELDAQGRIVPGEIASAHVVPAAGMQIDPKSLEITGIDIDHPFRDAKPERQALEAVFAPVRDAVKRHGCQRAILVGHNAHFDLNFLNAAVARSGHKRNPFHPFS
ncbi:exonuclease domain-containing protein, partial [Lysobacter sp. 2RAB21]